MIRLPGLLRRQGQDKMGERDVEGEREREQEGWSRRGTVLKKRRCWNRPWKMFNICGVCHFLWLRGRRNRGEGWGVEIRGVCF